MHFTEECCVTGSIWAALAGLDWLDLLQQPWEAVLGELARLDPQLHGPWVLRWPPAGSPAPSHTPSALSLAGLGPGVSMVVGGDVRPKSVAESTEEAAEEAPEYGNSESACQRGALSATQPVEVPCEWRQEPQTDRAVKWQWQQGKWPRERTRTWTDLAAQDSDTGMEGWPDLRPAAVEMADHP